MKILFVVRHAKSSWDDPSQSDFDRPLNERGKKDAPGMAEKLKDKKYSIDLFISSPAKRARKTAAHFIERFEGKEKEIQLVDQLYEASPQAFFNVVSKVNDEHKTIALFSHNPGITEFVNMLSEHKVANMPTCGIFGVKVYADSWADFKDAKKEMLLFDYPKND